MIQDKAKKDARFNRALDRNLFELHRTLSYRNASRELWKSVAQLDWSFFAYASLAMDDAMVSHAIKVLDKHPRVGSFFFLHKCDELAVERALQQSHLTIKDVESLAIKLTQIRNKTHFHIDKSAMFSPQRVWNQADITYRVFDKTILGIWDALCALFYQRTNRPFAQAVYDGSDIAAIIRAVESHGITT